jgi:hypothetical protein
MGPYGWFCSAHLHSPLLMKQLILELWFYVSPIRPGGRRIGIGYGTMSQYGLIRVSRNCGVKTNNLIRDTSLILANTSL